MGLRDLLSLDQGAIVRRFKVSGRDVVPARAVEPALVPRLHPLGGGELDLTDRQWQLVKPLLPPPRSGPAGGRPPKHDLREIVNAILYLVRTGCAWRLLPKDFPPWQTVYWYFAAWAKDGTLGAVHDALRTKVRAGSQRQAAPSAGVVDSQSLRGADTARTATRGYDAGKSVDGRTRHVVVDTPGLALVVLVTQASVQDRDGGRVLLSRLHRVVPGVRLVFADGGYASRLVAFATAALQMALEIVRKPEGQRGFEVLPRRWALERTFAWLMRHRRLVRDYERTIAHQEAMVQWAMVALMVRRLAPPPGPRPWACR